MSRTGRPLRFLAVVVGGWVLLRVGLVAASVLWQQPSLKPPIAAASPTRKNGASASGQQPAALLETGRNRPSLPPLVALPFRSLPGVVAPKLAPPTPAPPTPALPASVIAGGPPVLPPMAPSSNSLSEAARPASAPAASVPGPAPRTVRPSPWSLTGWVLWRRESVGSLAQAPLLGGSQGGVRLDYRLWQAGSRSLGIYGRVTRALERPFAEEVAFGLSLRPVEGLPVTLLAERRQRLGAGGRNGFAFLAAGGIGPRDVLPRLEVEGYAQAGVVAFPGSDSFADGRLSLDYRLTRKATQPDVALGVVVSGGAQTGASRLDIGPELRLRLPVAGGHVRFSAEWRQRVAGRARPASGPALTLVSNF
jgi:hypothetical protein